MAPPNGQVQNRGAIPDLFLPPIPYIPITKSCGATSTLRLNLSLHLLYLSKGTIKICNSQQGPGDPQHRHCHRRACCCQRECTEHGECRPPPPTPTQAGPPCGTASRLNCWRSSVPPLISLLPHGQSSLPNSQTQSSLRVSSRAYSSSEATSLCRRCLLDAATGLASTSLGWTYHFQSTFCHFPLSILCPNHSNLSTDPRLSHVSMPRAQGFFGLGCLVLPDAL